MNNIYILLLFIELVIGYRGNKYNARCNHCKCNDLIP